MHTISIKDYIEAGQIFHWAVREHYQVWFTGSLERHRRTEVMLPRLVKRGKLVRLKYGKRFIYSVPRRKNVLIEHGLGCTESLVRIWRSKMDGVIISERFFKGLGSVPDWGIKYSKQFLLFEYSSKNNFEQARIVKTKVTKYKENIPEILDKFEADEAFVLFVLDVSRDRVKRFVKRVEPGWHFFFTDYETFKSVPLGKQLQTPIYLWGDDGKEYPLTK